jgi:hypothetical protein
MADRNFVPRSNDTGSIGTTSKRWLKGWFADVDVSGRLIGTASWAVTSSYSLNAGALPDSASYAISASWAPSSLMSANVRQTAYSNGGILSSASVLTSSIKLDYAYILYNVTVNKPSRIRFYTSASYQITDLTRPYTISPTGIHGVVADIITEAGALSVDINPFIIGVSKDQIPTASIAYTINSLTGSTETFTVTASYLPLENSTSSPSSIPVSASYALTASYADSSSWSSSSISSSYALTASYAANSSAGSSISSSWASSSISASYAVTSSYAASGPLPTGFVTFYDLDGNGDIQPAENVIMGSYFEWDGNGDLEPML